MKHIKYIAIPAILAVVFACSGDYDYMDDHQEIITFKAFRSMQQTKGTTPFPQTSDFSVTAFHTQGEAAYQYFGNVRVYSSASNAWSTAQTLYWPKGASGDGTLLEFRAYSPYASSEASPWCTFPNSTSLEGSYSFSPAASPDLMYSNPVAMSPSSPAPVSLTFNHALGQTTFTFTCARFDDSVEKTQMSSVTGQTIDIYDKYTQKESPVSDPEQKSFVFRSGNYPTAYATEETPWTLNDLAYDLQNPIQNIIFVEVTEVSVNNFAWSGELAMTTTDGTTWTKPANSVWTSPSNRDRLPILSEPFYFSPNTKGFAMPFGTYVVLPQDLEPVLSSQKPTVTIHVNFKLFRAEENAANDSGTSGDARSQIYDYRDLAQYFAEDDGLVDGDTRKSGRFKKWHSDENEITFPNGFKLTSGKALLRKDVTPTLEISKTITLPLYDSKTSNPRYLKMNTNTTYSIVVDPFGEEITFSPTVDNWLEQSAEE